MNTNLVHVHDAVPQQRGAQAQVEVDLHVSQSVGMRRHRQRADWHLLHHFVR